MEGDERMNELIDLKKIWDRAVELWRTNFPSILACVLFFFFGVAWGTKAIVDDCKFAKTFRDGSNVYNCELRLVR
jgi:putative alpha-1,2-mannosidase